MEKGKFFFYPAQFWSHKNHYNLLLAFKEFSKLYPSVKLVLSGSDKGNLPYIKEVIDELTLDDAVCYAGFAEMEEVYTFYKNSIALIMPTFLGPTNLPLLEAAMLGTPVIASDLKGHKELLGNYAAYIDPADHRSIFVAMVEILQRNVSTRIPYINTRFTLEACLVAIEEILPKLVPYRRAFGYNFQQY